MNPIDSRYSDRNFRLSLPLVFVLTTLASSRTSRPPPLLAADCRSVRCLGPVEYEQHGLVVQRELPRRERTAWNAKTRPFRQTGSSEARGTGTGTGTGTSREWCPPSAPTRPAPPSVGCRLDPRRLDPVRASPRKSSPQWPRGPPALLRESRASRTRPSRCGRRPAPCRCVLRRCVGT